MERNDFPLARARRTLERLEAQVEDPTRRHAAAFIELRRAIDDMAAEIQGCRDALDLAEEVRGDLARSALEWAAGRTT